ncbi:ATPase family AAA domain-containing protein 1-A [Tolypocladium ophioglossoides CBS 100239]|uniref:ATPase family AAA domain-containing protein 1-A n=1 Tax=Tolypocladium ophioglossoides (strain CBS 100239) TaxID=1163406 RepID=A0A0L0NEY8_TOLOC|nr:ATPase family AAA domain-containing protein 1-A [Tolypocladium ophioglossoides CBS 100239]
MHAPAARRAFPTVALAARVPRGAAVAAAAAACRSFHAPPSRRNAHGPGGKPVDDSVTEHDDDPEPQAGTETSGGRTRSHAVGPARSRNMRRRVASALPPVNLPSSFLDNNVSIYSPGTQPRLPIALVEDAKHDKVSRLFVDQGPGSQHTHQTLESYFETALSDLLLRDCELAMDFVRSRMDDNNVRWNSPEPIERVLRLWDMILDSAWHLTDALYPARQAEYTYKVRPFWWWHMYKDLDQRTHKFRDQFLSLAMSLDNQLKHAERLDYPLPHAVADLPADTLVAMQKALNRDLLASPPPNFDPKTSKRPITVLSLSGYGGTAVSEAVGEHLAFWNHADLVRLDAYDLSVLVGDYLGQNWAYSRGALSMMGFRAAELNGKLARDYGFPGRHTDDEDHDVEAGLMGLRTASGTLEDELQKIKQGGYDCFSKWENLKIDKILDHIIRSADLKSQSSPSRPVLIHIHDLVELSMTLEGSLLISRLRVLVDAAWQQGAKIAILGTSSCEQPSEEYQNAILDLAGGDLVITRHVQPERADRHTAKGSRRFPFSLQKADYFVENLHNINRMLEAMDPGSIQRPLDLSSDSVRTYLLSANPRFSILRDSVLPVREIYHLACAFRALKSKHEGCGSAGFLERFKMGPLRQKPGQPFLDEERPEYKGEPGEAPNKTAEEAKGETRASMKLNEYEKRISVGQIHRENLRTTFADVHAPAETISALKLLTSLALVRPDAFAYGVLAQDKISGCLLYGPPGTGKTMLAKAVAKESGANMLEISGATINDKWVGESEKLIRAVFTLAKRLSPCVVFIDEADSLLANRSMFSNRPSHREHINQFLKEWDGMEETNAFIMVATNRPFDLDDAVLRRLPRKILVDLPLKDDRATILRLLLKGETLDDSVSLDDYAARTPHYSGSDLKNVCVAAAMAAVEEENEAAAKHTGPEAFRYPERRVLRRDHFERAVRQIPASISEDMVSLKMIRKFDEEYGNRKKGAKKKAMGFGVLDDKQYAVAEEARIRPGGSGL